MSVSAPHRRRPAPWRSELLADLEREARGGDVVVVRDGVPHVAVGAAELLSLVEWVRNLQSRLEAERAHRVAARRGR